MLVHKPTLLAGYDYQQVAPNVIRAWLTLACSNCCEPIALNIHTVQCNNKALLRHMNEWVGHQPTDGYYPYTNGPIYCGKCLRLWRDPASSPAKDLCNG